jgi:hypothetical protein
MAKDAGEGTAGSKSVSRAKSAEKMTKSAKKVAPPKSAYRSEAYVVNSDDEDASAEERKAKKVVSEPAPVAAANGVLNISDSSSHDESEEDAGSSSDRDAGPPSRPPNKVPINVNGVKRTSTDASESEEESVESDEQSGDESPEPAAKKQRLDSSAGPQSSQTKLSSSKSQPIAGSAAAPRHVAPTISTLDADDTGPLQAKPFRPPAGYVQVNEDAFASNNILSDTSLDGRQIWHISAPHDVPLTSIREIAGDALRNGKPVLSHNGVNYKLKDEDAGTRDTAVHVPGKDGYKLLERQIERTMHLQQQLVLPNLTRKQVDQATGSTAAGDVARAPVKSVRPQPEGLRMRYRPPGVAGVEEVGWSSTSDEETEEHAGSSSIQFPRAVGGHGVSQDHTQAEDARRAADATPKKSKKKHKDRPKDDGADANPQASISNGRTQTMLAISDEPHISGTAKSLSKTAPEMTTPGTEADRHDKPRLSKAEKMKRKEEKRLKKERKLQAEVA